MLLCLLLFFIARTAQLVEENQKMRDALYSCMAGRGFVWKGVTPSKDVGVVCLNVNGDEPNI